MKGLAGLFLLLGACTPSFSETFLVLPFFNTSGAKTIDWIGESISEKITEALAAEDLLIVQRSDREKLFADLKLRRYAPLTRGTIMEIAINLDAGVVVFGDFEVGPGDGSTPRPLTIRAEVVNVRAVRRDPPHTQSGSLDELSQLQNRVAWYVLKAVLEARAPAYDAFLRRHRVTRLDALENYIRGLTAVPVEQKLKLLSNAARLQEGFTQPAFELGKLHWSRKDYKAAAEWLQKVDSSDPNHRDALFYLGLSRYMTGDFQAAADALQTVANAVPLAEVLNNLGAARHRLGEGEALSLFRRAIDSDSADPDYHFNAGFALWKQGRFEEAAESFRAVLQRVPEDQLATLMLGRCLNRTGPRPGDPRSEGLERLKLEYSENAWRHLKAVLEPARK